MTHHPNTPASSNEAANKHFREEQPDGSINDVDPADMTSRTEQAAPSVASGAPLPKGALGTLSNVIATLREYGRFDDEEGDATDILDDLHEWLQALAAPGAAIAASEQEVGWTDDQMIRFGNYIRSNSADSHEQRLELFRKHEALRGISAPRPASREEAPPASASPATVAQPVGWQVRGIGREDGPGEWRYADEEDIEAYRNTPDTWELRPVFAQPCASQGCGGDGGEPLTDERIADAVPVTATILPGNPRKVCMTLVELRRFIAALSGLEHVGKESE